MLEGIQSELIMLPLEIKDQIIPKLRESGIEVSPSVNRTPRRFRDASDVLTCTQGDVSVDILITREDYLPELQNSSAVLMLPDSGFSASFRNNAGKNRLRKTISALLYELKGGQDGRQHS